MNHPLPSLRPSLRNISTSQPSRCLVLTHLLWYNIRLAAAPLTSSFGWRPHTELTHSPPCPSRRGKPSMLKSTSCISWILQLHRHCTFSLLAFIFMVTYSKQYRLLTGKLLFWQLSREFHNKAQEKYSLPFWCLS